MNRWLIRVLLLAMVLTVMWSVGLAQKVVTIPQLQQTPLDSLKKLDTLQAGTGGKSLQQSPYWHGSDATGADTVTITGVVIVKPGILTYTLARYNIYLQDTTSGAVFAGINVLTNDTSTQAQSTGITALDTGMVVTLTGRVTEFGSQNNSLTELFHYTVSAPIYTGPPPISIGNIIARPAAREIQLGDLANGNLPKPSTGEKYESMYVVVRNVTVISADYSTGRFSFQDSLGNIGYMYDGSGWYTLRGHKFSSSRYTPPPVGTKLSYLRGVVLPQTRSLTCGDYTIQPLYPGPREQSNSKYPGDIGIASFSPQITGITRTPTPPKRTDVITVTWKAKNLNTGGKIDSSFFDWKIGWRNGLPWNRTKAVATSGDSLYVATIPAINADTLVGYFTEAYGGGVYGAAPDSSIPNFFQIRQSGLTVRDVQFTPFVNGLSGFVGDTVTVSGVVTADTTDIKQPISSRPRLWMAAAAGAWNGIAVWAPALGPTGLDTLVRGDSIQITGIVDEKGVSSNDSRTSIQVLTLSLKKRGVTVPAATTIGMSGSGSVSYQDANRPVKGTTAFEQWESVLIKTPTVYVNMLNADNAAVTGTSNFGEFFVSTTKGATTTAFGIRVNDDGTNSFYCDTTVAYKTSWASSHPISPAKTKAIPVGASIGSITAIMTYSNGEYKLEPRKNDDFGTITGITYKIGDIIPQNYELSQNYPNPFNPSTTIRYSLPTSSLVTLRIFNILGQEVMRLVDGQQKAGAYAVVFDASRLSSGVYFYQLQTDAFSNVKKMMLLK
jgi:hypothetical protein